MAYSMYIAGFLMPVTPSKVTVKVGNLNNTIDLISGEQINIPHKAGLTSASFKLSLPQVKYPYSSTSLLAAFYLKVFDTLKESQKPFQWILFRKMPNNKRLFYTNYKMLLEDYSIVDDASEGFDVTVDINLKEYRSFGTKTLIIQSSGLIAVKKAERNSSTAPQITSWVVGAADTLWNIAKICYGNGAKYTDIFNANKDKLVNAALLTVGETLTIP